MAVPTLLQLNATFMVLMSLYDGPKYCVVYHYLDVGVHCECHCVFACVTRSHMITHELLLVCADTCDRVTNVVCVWM